jgi:VCBS repeat-containing protein
MATHDTTMWIAATLDAYIPNVFAAEYATDGTLYIGGDFTHVGPPTGGHGVIDMDGTLQGAYPYVDGTVYATVPDDNGGFYIGGSFTSVGGVPRENLARIRADGTLDPTWNPGANGVVFALATDMSYVYAGGTFTSAGGRSYSRLTRIDRNTGLTPIGFSPTPNGIISTILVSGDYLYVGGTFTTISGQTRSRLAKIWRTTASLGQATTWNPDANGEVKALASDGTYLFVGGNFTTIAGATRDRLAKFSIADGSLVAGWDPVANATVETIAINKSSTEGPVNRVLVGGAFTEIDSVSTGCAAVLGYTTGTLTGLTLGSPNNTVRAIVVGEDDYIYMGGVFNSVYSQTDRRKLVRFANDSSLTPDGAWNPVPLGTDVKCVTISTTASSTKMGVGGDMFSVGAHRRNRIAALDTTGKLKSWYPTGGANDTVLAIEATGNGKLYIGGDFTTVGGSTRNRIAELNPSTAAVMSFNPNADGTVQAVVSDGTTVYAGGDFGTIGGQTRARIAALDSAGTATAWYQGSGATDTVYTLRLSPTNDALYVGGEFAGIFNVARNRLARLQTASPVADSWHPDVTGTSVDDLLLTSGALYVGGSFSAVGASSRSNLAAVSTSTGAATSWAPDPDGRVLALAKSSAADVIVIGGSFETMAGAERPYAAAVRPDGTLTSWTPDFNKAVETIAANATGIVSGGRWDVAYPAGDLARWFGPMRFALDDVVPAGSISINAGAVSTADRDVTISISITDDSPVVTQQFGNSSSGPWTAAEPLGTERAYTLPIGDGTKTVYGRFVDESNNVRITSDSIVLDTGTPNTAPVANADAYDAVTGETLAVSAPGVLGNDTDAEGNALLADLVTDPAHGTLALATNGSFTYAPDAGFTGADSFTYRAYDGTAYSNTFSVTITVGDAPPFIAVAGTDRISTAIEASKLAYPDGLDPAGEKTVVIATGRNWPDALGGSALAGVVDGPILLTEPGTLPGAVLTEIGRLRATKAIILGGTSAVSTAVESALNAELGTTAGIVTRIAGDNRYETADAVAIEAIDRLGAGYDGTAFVATGGNFPDALAAAPLAAAARWPLFLAHPTSGLSADTKAAMDGVGQVLILGGTSAVSTATETYLETTYGAGDVDRLAGDNRYDTAAVIATYGVTDASLSWNRVGIATGENYPDALAGGVLQGKVGSVMLLTQSSTLSPETESALSTHKGDIATVTFFGGLNAVTQAVRDAVIDAVD